MLVFLILFQSLCHDQANSFSAIPTTAFFAGLVSGRPVVGMAGVTVVAPSAMLADGLSTTLFVLGPDAGAAFLDRWYPSAMAL